MLDGGAHQEPPPPPPSLFIFVSRAKKERHGGGVKKKKNKPNYTKTIFPLEVKNSYGIDKPPSPQLPVTFRLVQKNAVILPSPGKKSWCFFFKKRKKKVGWEFVRLPQP